MHTSSIMAEQERKIARQESRKIARKKTKLQAESVAKLDGEHDRHEPLVLGDKFAK